MVDVSASVPHAALVARAPGTGPWTVIDRRITWRLAIEAVAGAVIAIVVIRIRRSRLRERGGGLQREYGGRHIGRGPDEGSSCLIDARLFRFIHVTPYTRVVMRN